MSPEKHRSVAALTGSQSRRTALHAGGALLAGMGALAFRLQGSAAAQSTPTASAQAGSLLVQSFSHGTLFPTQGDVEGVPYTVYLWDAADRGFFFADCTSGVAGVVPSEQVLASISTDAPVRALLVPGPMAGDDGSDPGAVTYQGEPLASEDATSWLGTAPAALREGPQELGHGFLIISGLSGFDSGSEGVLLNLT